MFMESNELRTPIDRDGLERGGYAICSDILSDGEVETLLTELDNHESVGETTGNLKRHNSVYAMRNLLAVPTVRKLAQSPQVRQLVEPILGRQCFAVRGILFDKTPDANWKVVWHQDLTIAVEKRLDTAGYGPWSKKAGVVHVQPPIDVFEGMLTVRLHLDHCGAHNGPLRVLPGSHRFGRFTSAQIQEQRTVEPELVCSVSRGGVLLMRPLILHASSPATEPAHRRVVHLEWAAKELPNGLKWQERV
jgi:ectoine hydroxylase-related dioxygenase (phytanoyl-CoA dioxygenase family)